MKTKRFIIIISVVVSLLLIPAIAMQFTKEVNWTLFDFLVAASLLLIAGLTIEFILRKEKTKKYRVSLLVTFLVIFVLTWIELAVGIFGTPLSGK